VLRDPFRRFLAGATLSLYGDWLTTVAMVVLVLRVTGSTAAPAGYMLARVLPRVVGASPGGNLADRFGGARVVAICSMLQGILTATIILAEHGNAAWGVFLAVALAQLVNGVARSAMGTIIPTVVLGEGIQRANAMYNFALASSLVLGPAIGAPFLAWKGPDLLLWIDVATFAVASLLMATLPTRAASSARRLFAGALPGLRLVRDDPTLRAMAFAYLADAIAVTAAGSVLVLAAEERLGGDGVVGLLYAAVGVGDIIGALIGLRRKPPVSVRFSVSTTAITGILALAVFVICHNFWLAILPLILNGTAEVCFQTWGPADMQRRVNVSVLGRVNAVIVLAQSTGMVIGAVGSLILVPLVHWDRALYIACCVALVVLFAGVVTGRSREAAGNPDLSEGLSISS
jgi:MFS family permease